MTLADFVVVEVVRRRYLDAAGTELGVDVVVGNDRNNARRHRYLHALADEVTVALVAGAHRERAIGENRLRARGRDLEVGDTVYRAVDQWITHVVKETFFLDVQYFQVGDRGVQHRVPVDQAFAAIDQVFLVQLDEDFLYRCRQSLVHGEALARPVRRGAHAPQLARNGTAGFRLPLPDALGKSFAAEVVAGFTLLTQLSLDHHLRGDAGMVGARLP